jgi:AbrB family looped-hinge helix DNA binding protein
MSVATVTSKGQITLPADIRRSLGLHKGSKVIFRTEADGWVRLSTDFVSASEVAGILWRPNQPKIAAEDMRQLAGEAMAKNRGSSRE